MSIRAPQCREGTCVTDRLPCATAQVPRVTASFITTEPVRAFSTMRAAGLASSTFRFSMSARKATRSSPAAGASSLTVRPSIADAVPGPLTLLIALATARAVADRLQLRDWDFAYQSQGMTQDKWLGPTVEQTLDR